jgi:acyl-CoA synthetase (NDP forming)/GNAT superfamily N-acetyltransferase
VSTVADPGELARWEADAVLADGGTVHLRPIRPDDASRLNELHERLSRESKYLRFFSPMPHLSPGMLERFVTVDYVDRFALVAVLGDDIVGVARYDALGADHRAAEVAFTVDDAHQGRGLATLLLEHLAAVAADRGITRFVAETLPGNNKMLAVFRDAGYGDERHFEGGTVQVAFSISPTPASIEAVHERERRAAAASVRRLLAPRSLVVVGAGREAQGIGHEVFRNVLRSGYTGVAYPVNHSATSVASVRAFPDVSSVPEDVDLAVIVVPASEVPAVVDDCGRKGVASLIVMSEGFADAGVEGAAAERALVERARAHGMRLLGPNCMGVANTAADVRLNASLARDLPPPGRVGFMAQSGALGAAIFDEARRRGIGVSSFVSAGNRADISSNDLIQYWDDDDATDVVLLYIESFGNPRTFARVTRRLSRRKPVVAVKGGRSAVGRLFTVTPWSSPAVGEDLVDALFRHTGVIRVDTLAQLFDVADVLAHQPLPAGRRVGIVANAGGAGVLVADACEDAGLVVPTLSDGAAAELRAIVGPRGAVTNPVTLAGTASADVYERVLSRLVADDAVDAVIVAFLHPLATPPGEVAAGVRRAVERSSGDKPVLANFMAAREAAGAFESAERAVPVFAYPEAAAQALARVVELVEWRAKPAGSEPAFDDIDHDAGRALVEAVLAAHPDGAEMDGGSAGVLFEAYGIPMAPTRAVQSADEAMDGAAATGFPVVLKGPDGVPSPGLHTPAEVARAWDQLAPGPAVVQPLLEPGVATAIQVSTHPSFGPLIAFGIAGPTADIYDDRSLRVLPLSDVDADELIGSVRGAALLLGYRGQPGADLDALRDVLLRISRLALDLPEVAALVADPVVAAPTRAIAVDARVAVAPYRTRPELALRRLR